MDALYSALKGDVEVTIFLTAAGNGALVDDGGIKRGQPSVDVLTGDDVFHLFVKGSVGMEQKSSILFGDG